MIVTTSRRAGDAAARRNDLAGRSIDSEVKLPTQKGQVRHAPDTEPNKSPSIDRSNRLGDLAGRIADAHAQVGYATSNVLHHAITAGEMLIEAKDCVGHGRWENWLKKTCNIPPRTASRYMLLAKRRELIDSKSATMADLTVNAAVRLLKPKKGTRPKPSKKSAVIELSSLCWSSAPAPARTRFVDDVGLQALYEAARADQREHFRAWLLQRDQPAAERAPPEALSIPDDLSIPKFLYRARATEPSHED